MTCERVLFVDDDPDVRAANVQALQLEGLHVDAFASARDALAGVTRDFPGVVVSDLRMPGEDGHALFRRVRALDPELPVLLITGHADVAEAVQALHDGAFDFVAKPYAPDRLLVSVRRALAMRGLVLENRRLRALAARDDEDADLAGESVVMRRLREAVARIAGADLDVVLEGEVGTGKETAARALHRASRRRGRFMVVDCGDVDDGAGEAELFGAASGAARARPGSLEAAHRGLLFLRQVDLLPIRLQGRLLRVLETGVVGPEARPVDVRVAAAATSPLVERVQAGAFRADLYHRLNGVTLRIPPLRERREDLPLLFGRLLFDAARRLHTPEPALAASTWLKLQTHDWPGNLHELRAFADHVALGLAEIEDATSAGESLAERVAAFERQLISSALTKAEGDVAHVLRLLQLPRKTLYDKLSRHGLKAADFREGCQAVSGAGYLNR